MTFIEVDPCVLGAVAQRLREAVGVAREVEDHRERLMAVVTDPGDAEVGSALRSFLHVWGYGCGLLADDAAGLASRLTQASRCYVEVESSITEGFGGVG